MDYIEYLDNRIVSGCSTHQCYHVDTAYHIIKRTVASFLIEEVHALLPIADRRVVIVPFNVHLFRSLGKPIRTQFLQDRFGAVILQVLRICPVEEVHVHRKWERRRDPCVIPSRRGAEFQFLGGWHWNGYSRRHTL